jgi:hypothetical protein
MEYLLGDWGSEGDDVVEHVLLKRCLGIDYVDCCDIHNSQVIN